MIYNSPNIGLCNCMKYEVTIPQQPLTLKEFVYVLYSRNSFAGVGSIFVSYTPQKCNRCCVYTLWYKYLPNDTSGAGNFLIRMWGNKGSAKIPNNLAKIPNKKKASCP